MTNLVFFGAGASRPFGIPTMQEMVIEFEKTLKDNHSDLFGFYSKIKEVLIKEYGDSKIDIESMLSVINGIATNTKPTELGHFVFYYLSDICSHKKFSFDEIALGKKLEKQLHNYIEETCKTRQDDINKKYRRSYLPLFKHMGPNKRNYDGEKLSYDWKAYTTNYDNIFEKFWNEYEPPKDHFEKKDSSINDYFTADSLESEHTFCKLHGSLDWTKEVETHRIIRKTDSGFERNKTEGTIMLFPIQQKNLYLHPWFTLFSDLRNGLQTKDVWYVVGYAFNDEFIRNAFQESLVDDSKKKLVIINPEAEQIKGKFYGSLKNQIDVLPIKFGGKFFEPQFEDYVKKVKTMVLRFNTRKKPPEMEYSKIKIECNYSRHSFQILNDDKVDVTETNENGKQLSFTIYNPKNVEIKLELKIGYRHNDDDGEIELYLSDNTKELDVGIDCGGKTIANSQHVKGGYVIKNGTVWLKNPIKLDKTKLYRQVTM